ncbi:MAG: HAMP domain-containing protein [Burkholderiaceae bacterium]|nr:MAG: HAMP domain-containing protein [Burkholderiaceae bacterium]TAM03230.1 MAG: HAMP domain-containing protein [Pusillimonas sp.]
MGARVSFKGLTVRTSLVLVLAFFMVMLLASAALGVYSLRENSSTLNAMLRNQDANEALAASIDHFKNVQVAMGLGVEAVLTKQAQEKKAKEDPSAAAAEIGEEVPPVQTFVDRGKKEFAESQKYFDKFRKLSTGETGIVYNTVLNSYESLMRGGVEPLFDFLRKGDIEGYNAFKDSTGEYMLGDLYTAVAAFDKYHSGLIDQVRNADSRHYELAIKVVVAGLILSFLICILAYVFLGRVVLRPLQLAGLHFDRIANGDLTQRVELRSRNEIGVLYENLKRMQEGLTRTVTAVREGVQEIDVGAREIFVGNTDLSSRTEQQAASLQETAASMEQLASTVRQNTDNALQADGLAKEASNVAHRGGDAVSAVVGTMEAITSSSSKIAEIVSVIDGIAFQTNILALNAAVEAARAGEQGKGFAVVAGEVRSLAQRSAQAAKEIKVLIEESLDTIRSGARQADEAGKIMSEVVQSVHGVTTIMSEISSASHEQAQGIDQVNQAVTQMDAVVQQNASLVQQAAAAAGSLQEQATRLTEAVAVFKINASEIIDVGAPQLQRSESDGEAYDDDPRMSLQLASQS